MALEKLIKELESEFPPSRFQWCLSRSHDGRYFANIFPCALGDVGKGPDNAARDSTSAQRCLRAALTNARRQGVGPRLYGQKA